jgi:hypothetical protein
MAAVCFCAFLDSVLHCSLATHTRRFLRKDFYGNPWFFPQFWVLDGNNVVSIEFSSLIGCSSVSSRHSLFLLLAPRSV